MIFMRFRETRAVDAYDTGGAVDRITGLFVEEALRWPTMKPCNTTGYTEWYPYPAQFAFLQAVTRECALDVPPEARYAGVCPDLMAYDLGLYVKRSRNIEVIFMGSSYGGSTSGIWVLPIHTANRDLRFDLPDPLPMPAAHSLCVVCSERTHRRCAGCGKVFYCSKEHQRADRAVHKAVCSRTAVIPLPRISSLAMGDRSSTVAVYDSDTARSLGLPVGHTTANACKKCCVALGPGARVVSCSRCELVKYCSSACKKADRKVHKTTCK